MIATVRVYYNTGLTVNNCLDNISKLDTLNFASRDFSNIAIKQDRGLISIRLNTVYDNIKDGDYAKINNIGYWITGITMLNDNVAEVSLQQDYLTTVGVDNLIVVSGQCTRKCVTDDTLFANTLPESFSPTNESEVNFGKIIKPSDDTSNVNIVLSTVNLEDVTKKAAKYVEDTLDPTSAFVLVPNLPGVTNPTTYNMIIDGNTKSTQLPTTVAYNFDNTSVKNNINDIRSLGVESSIVASYSIPTAYLSSAPGSGTARIGSLTGIEKTIQSALAVQFGSYKNNKVYSGQYCQYVLGSLVSGETRSFKPEEIVGDDGILTWQLNSDPMYNGYPTCKPSKYLNDRTFWLGTIKGATWLNSPIVYSTPSGNALYGEFNNNDLYNGYNSLPPSLRQMVYNLVSSLDARNIPSVLWNVAMGGVNENSVAGRSRAIDASSIAALGGAISNFDITKPLSSIGHIISNKFNQATYGLQPPDIKFSMIPNLQAYVGNYFYEYRVRMSNADMRRFDDYLTKFGYAVDENLTSSCFKGRQNFNYVQASEAIFKTVNNRFPQYLLQGVSQQLNDGVRIWHVAPSESLLYNNPIA